MRSQDLDTVKSAFLRLGVTILLAKRLARERQQQEPDLPRRQLRRAELIPFRDSSIVRSSKGRAASTPPCRGRGFVKTGRLLPRMRRANTSAAGTTTSSITMPFRMPPEATA